MKNPVNFVFIITDQQRADFLGCAGHPVLRTPGVDSLAASGFRLENMHTASPVCMPNRASLLTGRHPSAHGLRRNGLYLPRGARTFAELLSLAGYDTALFGKSHVQPMLSTPPEVRPEGAVNPAAPEARRDDGEDYGEEEPGRWSGEAPFAVRLPHYGFAEVALTTLHSDQCGGHYYQGLRAQTPDADELRDKGNRLPHGYACPQAERTRVPEHLYPTAYVRDRAAEFLRAPARKERPFFAFVSFPDPHHPFTPPGKYWDMYSPADMPAHLPYEAHRNPPPHLAAQRALMRAGAQNTREQKAFMADARELREAMALTCGMIAMIDDAVVELLSVLDAEGLRQNTVVVFTSDHGDYLGDFGLLLKGPAMLRGLTRVPFVWSDPAEDFGGRVSEALCSTVDIPATILSRAGVLPYHGMQGRDFLPAVRGEAPGREEALIEFEDNSLKMGFEPSAVARSLLTNRYRLTLYLNEDWGELYDLREDPQETRNLWDEEAYADIRADLIRRLALRMMAERDISPFPKRRA